MSFAIKTLQSSLFILLIKLVHRGIGFVSVLILARILTPEDFGVVAIANMLVFLCDVLTESGVQQYIVQKESVDNSDLNSSWTLNLLLKAFVCILFVLSSSYVADYFNKSELINSLIVISLILPIGALANPGLHLLKREFNYQPIMRLLVTEKVLSFIVTVSLAFYLRSYWAMIFGVVSSYLFRTIGSYYINLYRPKFELGRAIDQWRFSKWMLLKGTVGYAKTEFDTFLISNIFSFDVVGGFNMMKSISALPATEIIKPITEPLLASFSKVKSNSQLLNYQISLSLCLLVCFTAPIGVFLWAYDDLIVQLLFDDRWWKYSPVLGILSVLVVNYSIVSVFHEALLAVGKIKLLFYYDLVTFFLIVSVLSVMPFNSILDFALARTTIALVSVSILTIIICVILKLSIIRILIVLSPVFISTISAFWVTNYFNGLDELVLFVNLPVKGMIFTIGYFFSIALSFHVLSFRKEILEVREFVLNLSFLLFKKFRN